MKIIAIVGPTGSGKTKLSISLAKKLNAVIINADATQVYKETSIGTAKVTLKEMEGVPHYMLDLVSIFDEYTVKDYQKDARKILDEMIENDRNVIIVGGSGLYIKALLYDYKFSEEEKSFTYPNLTNEELKRKVDSIYKENNIHVNNRKRLERFLSHYESTHEIIKNKEEKDTPLYDFTLLSLKIDLKDLEPIILVRTEEMMCDGFIEEARNLFNKGAKKAETMIGYKELYMFFRGEITFYDAIMLINKNTRKYAKRQYTWINGQFKDVHWIKVNTENFEETIKKAEEFI